MLAAPSSLRLTVKACENSETPRKTDISMGNISAASMKACPELSAANWRRRQTQPRFGSSGSAPSAMFHRRPPPNRLRTARCEPELRHARYRPRKTAIPIIESRYQHDVVAAAWREAKSTIGFQLTAAIHRLRRSDAGKCGRAAHVEPHPRLAADEQGGATAKLRFQLRLVHVAGLHLTRANHASSIAGGVLQFLIGPINEADFERRHEQQQKGKSDQAELDEGGAGTVTRTLLQPARDHHSARRLQAMRHVLPSRNIVDLKLPAGTLHKLPQCQLAKPDGAAELLSWLR